MPQFMHVNFAKKVIVGPHRTAEIQLMQPGNEQLLLQGTELGNARSVAFDKRTDAMYSTLVNCEDVSVLFGSRTPP
jgi:hypothetical protein